MESLGFSVQAEHAHRSQGQLPRMKCWVKAYLPITNTAGGVNQLVAFASSGCGAGRIENGNRHARAEGIFLSL